MSQSAAQTKRSVSWTFLTNHALTLLHLGRWPESTGLELATAVGITERAIRRIVQELQTAGYIEQERVGRRSRYRVDLRRPLARIGQKEMTVGQVLRLIPEAGMPEENGDGRDPHGSERQ